LPDGIFSNKNPNLGKFWRALEQERLVYSFAIWNVLRQFGTFYGHLVIWWQFGIFSLILVYCVKTNLATLVLTTSFLRKGGPAVDKGIILQKRRQGYLAAAPQSKAGLPDSNQKSRFG
jgi:hypothetical protein